MTLLNWITLLSYLALNLDIIFEIRRIRRTRSSRDLSLFGMTIRYLALFGLLIKCISVGDRSLIIGQALMTVTFTVYLIIAFLSLHRSPRR